MPSKPKDQPEFELRRAEPGQVFGYTTRAGEQREIAADEEGVVTPESREDVAILDQFDLPVARKAIAEAAADAADTDGGK